VGAFAGFAVPFALRISCNEAVAPVGRFLAAVLAITAVVVCAEVFGLVQLGHIAEALQRKLPAFRCQADALSLEEAIDEACDSTEVASSTGKKSSAQQRKRRGTKPTTAKTAGTGKRDPNEQHPAGSRRDEVRESRQADTKAGLKMSAKAPPAGVQKTASSVSQPSITQAAMRLKAASEFGRGAKSQAELLRPVCSSTTVTPSTEASETEWAGDESQVEMGDGNKLTLTESTLVPQHHTRCAANDDGMDVLNSIPCSFRRSWSESDLLELKRAQEEEEEEDEDATGQASAQCQVASPQIGCLTSPWACGMPVPSCQAAAPACSGVWISQALDLVSVLQASQASGAPCAVMLPPIDRSLYLNEQYYD